MDSPLRLMIELKPLQTSVPDTLASITLRYDELTCPGGMLTTAATLSEKEINQLRWYLEEYWQWPYEQFEERAKKIENALAAIGKRLYKAVFGTADAQQLVQPWNLQPGAERQISIVSDIPAVLSLPWELLHDERGFLVLRSKHPVSIVRQVSQRSAGTLKTPFEPPLRILLVTARPDDAGHVDPRSIARELLAAISEQVQEGTIELEFLRPPTVAQLRKRLSDSKRPPIHILHFDGHGAFGNANIANDGFRMRSNGPQGMLAFENEQGKEDLIAADELAQVLQDSGVKLAVFNACQSAVLGTEADDVFSSVATRMIQSGIDSVVAMSASVLVAAATRYVKAFYGELAQGTAVSTSQERARQALHDDPRRHVIRRTQDEEGKPVRLCDWWLPHYYQQRPVVFEASMQAERQKTSAYENAPLLSDTMPQEPRYGFTGRALELLRIERALLHKKLVVIHGFGGMGKTALAREAADWFTRTGMYHGACFISFEYGGDATTLLSAIGNFLDINDGAYNPNDPNIALVRIKTVVSKRPILVIVDNLESILPNGEAILESKLRSQLWNVLLKLREMGVGVLLTSRDTSFGDAQLAPGKYVMHLPLVGLYPDDAYILASNVLDALSIDCTRATYTDLRALLHQLDHHPLAIQLVLPQLQYLPMQTICTDFAALLLKFKDDYTTGRNASLLASLEYSLNRLTPEQRDLFPRLSVFEGGAFEKHILEITEMPEQTWASLRLAMEQAALLRAEQVHEVISIPFLHFHPVLLPYLRSQSRKQDVALLTRYVQQYFRAVNSYYMQDTQFPEIARAVVQRELPNLRKALNLLLENDNLHLASDIADRIIRFLNYFGLTREIEQIRISVAEKIKATSRRDASGALTNAEYRHESGVAGDERNRGELGSASKRFARLLAHIEAIPEGTPRGRCSYEHCSILFELGQCFLLDNQREEAEKTLRKALSLADILLRQDSKNQDYIINLRGNILGGLGNVLSAQGKYAGAKEMYEQARAIHISTRNERGQAVTLGALGGLAERQLNFNEARSNYLEALDIFRKLGEPASVALSLHHLGGIAEVQEEWAEAEENYRESVKMAEQVGQRKLAALNYHQLGLVAEHVGRSEDAKGWYKRAIQLKEQIQPGSTDLAQSLNNLADLLVDEVTNEVKKGRAAKDRLVKDQLAEARRYAEQAKRIREQPGFSTKIWGTYGTLARIASLEGRSGEARDYHRRERESFNAFAGNRNVIDQKFGDLIDAIAAANRGDTVAQNWVGQQLHEWNDEYISQGVHRILEGERNWSKLTENISSNTTALLILRILETVQQPPETVPSSEEEVSLEELVASLPAAFLEAMQQGDEAAARQVFEGLSEEEQERVADIIRILQETLEEEDGETDNVDEGKDAM